jgi:hypothetical protein
VRKAKKIASEVDRKRTNKITLLFASSMGSLPSPAQEAVEQYQYQIPLIFPINPGKSVINSVNGKRIPGKKNYDTV